MQVLDPQEIIDRLTAEANLARVEHAWTMEPLEDLEDLADLPAAMVFIGRENSGELGTWNPVEQKVTVTASVFVVCAIDELTQVRRRILKALIGFQPDADPTSEWDPIAHSDGATHSIRGDRACWLDNYTTGTTRTQS